MTLEPGTRLGPYEVVALIGAGGMGEVYKARDTRLRREVAVKRVAAPAAADPGRVRRFEQETRAAAALNHPNVLSVFDVGVHDGAPYLVSELLEGETLRERLRGGRLPLRSAIDLALQLLNGLAAAHDRGITHRDLKPENLFVTRDGRVKILDFGVAKLIEPEAGEAGAADRLTATGPLGTEPGAVVGTVGYMAPEQVRAGPADHRADIFAVGAILYEMLGGRRAFRRDTSAETMAAILNEDPPSLGDVHVSPAVERIVRRCLEKRPEQRFGAARDLAYALEAVGEDSGIQVGAMPRARRHAVIPGVAVLAGVAVAAIAFVAGRLTVGESPSSEVRVHRLTDWAGLEETPAISPDGRSVVFVASTGGSRQIWLRLVAGGSPLQLTRDTGDHLFPRWSPDSNSLLYVSPAAEGAASGALWEVPALGGPPRRIVDGVSAADISRDGAKLAFFRFEAGRVELAVADRDGSAVRPIAQLDTGYYYLSPRWSPDDRSIAYYRTITNIADLFVVPATGGTPRQVTHDATVGEGLTWSSDGSRIIFSSSRGATIRYLPTANLWSIAPDGRGLRQVTFGEATYTDPDMRRNGSIVTSRWRAQSDVWRIPIDGPPTENAARASRVTRQTSQVFTPSVAPDGTEVAYLSDAGGHANIWVQALATGESRQITYEQESDVQVGLPLWSPAGDRIAYFTSRRDSLNYWLVNPDGSSRRLLASDAAWAAWSSDGRWLYFSAQPGGKLLKKVPSSGGAAITVRGDTATRPALSPDGRTLYYVIELPIWTGGSDYEVRAASPEGGPGRLVATIPDRRMPRTSSSWQPVVSPDGRWLLLALVDDLTTNLWALSTTTGALQQLTDFQGRPTTIGRRASWAPDGRSVFAAISERDADIVLLEGLRER